jgi:hypothetical protein
MHTYIFIAFPGSTSWSDDCRSGIGHNRSIYIQGVSGGIVNILEGCSIDYSE